MSGLAYFGAGLGIGVALGVLFAPRSGAETRGRLREPAEEKKESVRDDTGYFTAAADTGEPYGDGM
jgi:gas vesicle protein